ncbi:MAG: IS200/IS605 family transposase [Lentisphaerae bacterium]|nr:IS200/IS605 family transposase [Lentisphaerota bacterium]
MPTYTQIYYHIVFSTKNRERVLSSDNRERLFRYIWGVVKNKKCHLYRVGGEMDHVHVFSDLHPTVCLSDFVKDIKVSSSKWIKDEGVFKGFGGWQDGYGAFTHAEDDKDDVIEYIKGQEEHHKRVSFMDEYRAMLKRAGIEFEEKYLV